MTQQPPMLRGSSGNTVFVVGDVVSCYEQVGEVADLARSGLYIIVSTGREVVDEKGARPELLVAPLTDATLISAAVS